MGNSTFKFVEGETIQLVKPMGCRTNADDDLALSQKGDEFSVDIPWIYNGKNGAKKPTVLHPDGRIFVTHKSHFDAADAYVVAKGSTSHGADRITQLNQRRAALETQMKACDANVLAEEERIEQQRLAVEKAKEVQAEALAKIEAAAKAEADKAAS